MSELKITREISLNIQRCWDCGNWVGIEPRSSWRCPCQPLARIDTLEVEVSELRRSNAALRGALTRVKRLKRVKK